MQTQNTDEKINIFLQIIETLNYDLEKSFKMIDNQLFYHRFLLEINNQEDNLKKILYICKKMNMPEKLFKIFLANVSDANILLLGFEKNEKNCVYKVYLEYWDRLKNKLYNQPNKIKPELLYMGLKWNPIDNTKSTVAQYICYPLLTVRSILKRLSMIYNGYKDTTSLEIVKEIIKVAQKRIIHNDSFIYLEVSEENNPRKSFDINLYKANLQLAEIHPFLMKMCQHYSINREEFDLLYYQNHEKILGHISGGIDREGRDFITIYYEI